MPEQAPKYGLALGGEAPIFTLPAVSGDDFSLSAHRGRQPVLLVFYRGWW